MNIVKKDEAEELVGTFIGDAFAEYARSKDVDLNIANHCNSLRTSSRCYESIYNSGYIKKRDLRIG